MGIGRGSTNLVGDGGSVEMMMGRVGLFNVEDEVEFFCRKVYFLPLRLSCYHFWGSSVCSVVMLVEVPINEPLLHSTW